MHEETKHVEPQTVGVPFILNHFLNAFSIKYFNFFCFLEQRNQWYTFMHNFHWFRPIIILPLNAMFPNNWQQVHWVFYFVNWYSSDIFSINWFKLFLGENFFIVVSNMEEITVVGSYFDWIVWVIGWPFIKIKLDFEYFAFITNQFWDINSFLHHSSKIISK